jgi:hypothetical protein
LVIYKNLFYKYIPIIFVNILSKYILHLTIILQIL